MTRYASSSRIPAHHVVSGDQPVGAVLYWHGQVRAYNLALEVATTALVAAMIPRSESIEMTKTPSRQDAAGTSRRLREGFSVDNPLSEVAPRIASYLHFTGLQQRVTKRARVTRRDAPARRGCYDALIEGGPQGQADHGEGILERDLLPLIDADRVEGGLVLDPQTGVLSWAQDVDGGESEGAATSH